MRAPAPMVTPHMITALDPIEAPSPTTIGSSVQAPVRAPSAVGWRSLMKVTL
jgi:hypothetical protein